MKATDFGLSVFYKPGRSFHDVVRSPYYVAPEVLCKIYRPEVDVWSAGVILYILLSGVPPFWPETESGIFIQILHGDLDFASEPWPTISDSAQDFVKLMFDTNPKNRISAHNLLCHPWIVDDKVPPDQPLDSAVLTRLKHFSAMNKLKKMALRAARQLEYFKGKTALGPNTDSLADVLAIAQHLDAVSGTEKQHVANDYAKRLSIGYTEPEKAVAASLAFLTEAANKTDICLY